MDIKTHKQSLLEKLYKPFQNCTSCPLGHQGRTNIVFGEGNPNSDLMFIGEGPGREEDITGRPFVGRSGKLLDKTLETIGIQRSNIFIANVVKCRPPENRKPTPKESKTCKNLLLLNQIKIIQPQLICTLGSSALEALIERPVAITKMRGKIFHHNDLAILPTFHPAYILRNRKKLETFTNDIKKALEFLK